MADEAPFQFLHSEVIQYIYKSSENGETVRQRDCWFSLPFCFQLSSLIVSVSLVQENGRNITKLENMGFRVGQGLIER